MNDSEIKQLGKAFTKIATAKVLYEEGRRLGALEELEKCYSMIDVEYEALMHDICDCEYCQIFKSMRNIIQERIMELKEGTKE